MFNTVAKNGFIGLIPNDISVRKMELDESEFTYTGSECRPAVTVAGLEEGTDYDVTYENNVNVGTAKVTAIGKGEYAGTRNVKTFEISAGDISSADAAVGEAIYDFGNEIRPAVEVKIDGNTISTDDYTVEYSDNRNVGTAAAVLKGKNNLKGSKTVTFEIGKRNISDAVVTGVTDKTYTGAAVVQNPVVTVAGNTLNAGTDYEVTLLNTGDYSDLNAGNGMVFIKGKGNFIGEYGVPFEIKKASISNWTIPSKLVYNGTKRTAVVSADGKEIDASEYSVAYYSDKNATKAVAASKVKGCGTYYVKITSKDVNYEAGSTVKKMVINPKAVTWKSLKGSKKAFTAKWKVTTAETTGYELRYSTSSKMKSAKKKTITKKKKGSIKVKKLKAKKKYYVQIRRYKKVGKVKYYSAWSKKKSVKTKK